MRSRAPAALVVLAALAALAGAAGASPTANPPTVTIAVEDDAAPWSDAQGQGYANDLVQATFNEVGWNVRLKVLPYARCKALVMAGRIAACFSASRTPELEAVVQFHKQPLFNPRNVLVARRDAPMSGCDAARWPRASSIGAVRGYEYRPEVEALLGASDPVRAELSHSEVANLRKLQAGRLDAAVFVLDEVKQLSHLARLAGLAGDMKASFKTVCDYGANASYVVFSPRHPQGTAALAAFEEGYARLRSRGAIAGLQARWRERAEAAGGVKKD